MFLRKLVFFTAVVGCYGLASPAPPALASVSQAAARADLKANDSVDWSVLGAPFTAVSNPVSLDSSLGLNLTVSMPAGIFERRDQSAPNVTSNPPDGNFTVTGWAGIFAPDDSLLWTRPNNGPLLLEFASPVSAAGAQIQRSLYGSYTATLEVFDSQGNSLATYTGGAVASNAGDNSAVFLGVISTSADIKRLLFTVDNLSDGFAINQLDLNTLPSPNAVPETSLWSLVTGAGVTGSVFYLRGSRRRETRRRPFRSDRYRSLP